MSPDSSSDVGGFHERNGLRMIDSHDMCMLGISNMKSGKDDYCKDVLMEELED